jgi:hypothetical protein
MLLEDWEFIVEGRLVKDIKFFIQEVAKFSQKKSFQKKVSDYKFST